MVKSVLVEILGLDSLRQQPIQLRLLLRRAVCIYELLRRAQDRILKTVHGGVLLLLLSQDLGVHHFKSKVVVIVALLSEILQLLQTDSVLVVGLFFLCFWIVHELK